MDSNISTPVQATVGNRSVIEYVEAASPVFPGFNFPSLGLSFDDCNGKYSKYRDYLSALVSHYGIDRPCAVVDLGLNVWAYTRNVLSPPCALARSTKAGFRSCTESDEYNAWRAYQSGGVGLYRCACLGLIDMTIPIKSINGNPPEVAAVLLIGQYRNAWHRDPSIEEVEDRVKDTRVSTDISNSLCCVRWLESDVDSIQERLETLSRFISNTTSDSMDDKQKKKRKCHIAEQDVAALVELMKQEIGYQSSLRRALHGLSPCMNGTSPQWIGGAFNNLNHRNGHAYVTFWEWAQRVSGQHVDNFQQWALPRNPTAHEDQAPFASSHRILQRYAADAPAGTDPDDAKSSSPAKTVRGLSSHVRQQPGECIRFCPEFSGGEGVPQGQLFIEGHWRCPPSPDAVEHLRDFAGSLADHIQDKISTIGHHHQEWAPVHRFMAEALLRHDRYSDWACELLTSEPFANLVNVDGIHECARSGLALTLQTVERSMPEVDVKNDATTSRLWSLLLWLANVESWESAPDLAFDALGNLLSLLATDELKINYQSLPGSGVAVSAAAPLIEES